MSQNGQTLQNSCSICCKIFKCVWPFWDIMDERVNIEKSEKNAVNKLTFEQLECPILLYVSNVISL